MRSKVGNALEVSVLDGAVMKKLNKQITIAPSSYRVMCVVFLFMDLSAKTPTFESIPARKYSNKNY